MSALNPSLDTLTTADMLIDNAHNGRTVLLFGDKHEQLVQAYRTAVDKAQEYKAEAFDLSCRCDELGAQLAACKMTLTCDTSEASAKLDELTAKAERLDATIDDVTCKLTGATGTAVHVPSAVRDACMMLADPANLNEKERAYRLGLLEKRELPDDHKWLQRQGFVRLYDAPVIRRSFV